jgi:hypothetical protein
MAMASAALPATEVPIPSPTVSPEMHPAPTASPESVTTVEEHLLIAPSPSPSGSPSMAPWVDATFLDDAHKWTSSFITNSVFNFDNWFGDVDTLEAGIEKPWIRVRVGADWDEVDGFKFKNRWRIDIPLPALENKLGVFIGRDSLENDQDDQDFFQQDDDNIENKVSVGLRYTFSNTEHVQFSTNFGMQFKWPPVFYVKPRMQFTFTSGKWLFRPIQYVYLYTDDGLGEKTKMEINWYLGSRFLLRSDSEAKYSNTTEGMDLSHTFSLQYLNFDVRHGNNYAASLEWGSDAHTWTATQFDRHRLTLRFYHTIFRPWLRLGIAPSLNWKRMKPDDDEDFPDYWKKAYPGCEFFVEILFEESEKYNPFTW